LAENHESKAKLSLTPSIGRFLNFKKANRAILVHEVSYTMVHFVNLSKVTLLKAPITMEN